MIRAVLFDYGNTLVDFYRREEFPEILARAVTRAAQALGEGSRLPPDLWARVKQEDKERQDLRVRPLEGRLSRIFRTSDPDRLESACRAFTEVIVEGARTRPGSAEVLAALRDRGLSLGLISNSPWGAPARYWREDLCLRGLQDLLDMDLFCRDVGLRKHSPVIFRRALEIMGLGPEEAVFVGDDPRWDVMGPLAVGMKAVLLDPHRSHSHRPSVRRLADLLTLPPFGGRGPREAGPAG